MAFPTADNSQITDSITQANTKVLGDSPAMAMGSLYMPTSQALGDAAHNATLAQQQVYQTSNATMVQGVSIILCVDTASTGVATGKIFGQAEQHPGSG